MAKKLAEKLTVFACVKVRDHGKASCGGCGARGVLEKMREELAAEVAAGRVGNDQIEIRPAGCLKKCKKGPALAVLPSRSLKAAGKAPKKAWKKAALKFKRVAADDAPAIVEKIRRRLILQRAAL